MVRSHLMTQDEPIVRATVSRLRPERLVLYGLTDPTGTHGIYFRGTLLCLGRCAQKVLDPAYYATTNGTWFLDITGKDVYVARRVSAACVFYGGYRLLGGGF